MIGRLHSVSAHCGQRLSHASCPNCLVSPTPSRSTQRCQLRAHSRSTETGPPLCGRRSSNHPLQPHPRPRGGSVVTSSHRFHSCHVSPFASEASNMNARKLCPVTRSSALLRSTVTFVAPHGPAHGLLPVKPDRPRTPTCAPTGQRKQRSGSGTLKGRVTDVAVGVASAG